MDDAKRKLVEEVRTLRSQLTKLQPLKPIPESTRHSLRGDEPYSDEIIEGMLEAITILDLDGTIRKVNSEFEKGSGWKRREAIGKTAAELGIMSREESQRIEKEVIPKLMEDGCVRDVETSVIRRAGTEFTALMSWTLIKDAKGKPTGIITAARDITEHKKAEKALRESEERFRMLFEKSPVSVTVLDPSGIVRNCSKATETLTGYSKEEIVGKPFEELSTLFHKDLPTLKEKYGKLSKGLEVAPYELEISRKDGETRWINTQTSPLMKEGILTGLQVISEDITEHKRAEEALRQSEEKFRSFSENAPDFVIQLDRAGVILFINRKYGNVSVEEVVETSIFAWLEEEHCPAFQRALARAFETAKPAVLEYLALGPGGEPRWYSGHLGPIVETNDCVGSVILVARDITERRKAEEEKRESEQKWRSLAENSPDFIYMADRNGKVLFINRTFPEHSGNQVIGKSIYDFLAPEYHDAMKERIEGIFQNGCADPLETAMIRRDGTCTLFETRYVAIKSGSKVASMMGIATDVTERKKAAEALRESEEEYRSLYESVHAGIILQSINGKIIHANKIAGQIFGMTTDQIMGKTSIDPVWQMIMEDGTPVPGEDHPSMVTIRTGEPVRDAIRGLFANDPDNIRWLHINTEPLLNPSTGKMEKVMVTFHDITERKQAEEALRESEEKFKAIFDNATDGILLAEGESKKFSLGNKAICQMLGYSLQELKGLQVSDIHPVEELAYVTEQFNKQLKGEITLAQDIAVKRRDGSIFYADVNSSSVMLAGKTYLLGTFRDITERKKAEEALQESEEKFRSLSESSPMGVWHTDKEGRVLYTNKRWQEITCLTLEESLGYGWSNALHPDDKERIFEEWDRCVSEEKSWSGEFRFVSPSGEVRWVYTTTAPTRSETGQVTGHVGSNEDITERKKAEEALRDSEERLRSLFETMTEGVVLIASDGQIVYANPASECIAGLKHSEIEGHSYDSPKWDMLRPDGTPMPPEEWAGPRAMEEKRAFKDMVMGVRRPDGSICWINLNATPIMNDTGEVNSIVLTFADITERKKTLEALRESEERYRRIFNSAVDAVCIVDSNGNIAEANPQMCKMYGYPSEDLIGHNAKRLVHPNYIHIFEKFRKDGAKGESFHSESKDIRKDGTAIDVEVSGAAINYKGERCLLAIIRDITERKKAELVLAESEERFRSIFENANDVIVFVNKTGKILEVNRKVKSILGYDRDEIVGKNFITSGILAVDNAPMIVKLFEESLKKEGLLNTRNGRNITEVWLNHKDGRGVLLEAGTTPIKKDGKLEGFLSVLRDVTERKKAEEELRIREQTLRALINAPTESAILVDTEGTILDINRIAAQRLGKSAESLIGMGIYDYLPADIAEYRKAQADEVVRSGKPVRFQDERGGRHYDTNVYPVFDEEGKVSASAVFSGDITERKKAEEALRESEEKFRSLSESSPMGVWHTDNEGRVLYTNKRWQEITGLTLEESLGFGWNNALHPDDKKRIFEEWDRCVSEEKSWSGEFRFVSPSGEVRWVYTKTAPTRSETGQVTGHVGSNEDITERKKAEEELRQYDHIVSSSKDMMALLDKRFTYIAANASYLETFNKTRDDMIGHTVPEVFGDEFFETVIKPNAERCLAGEEVNYQAWFDFPASERRYMDINYYPYIDANNEILGFVVNGRNITERRQADEALRQSEERLKILFESAPDAIYLNDLKGNFVEGNKAAEEMTGYAREELIGKNFGESGLLSPKQLLKATTNLAKNAIGKPTGPDEFTLRRKDGSCVSSEIRTFPVRIENQTLVLGIARDISERKEAEKALRKAHDELEERVRERTAELEEVNCSLQTEVAERKKAEEQVAIFRRFTEASEQGLGMADLAGNITYANATLCRFLGAKSAEDVHGTNVADYYLEEDLPSLQDEILPMVIEGEHRAVEIPLVSVEGKITPAIQSIFAIRDDEGKPFCLANVITDITERKRAEEELRRHRDHLEEMVTERTSELERINKELQLEIAERKQAQQSLEESESRFRELVENIREVFWMENSDGTELLYVSPAYEEIWERSCEEFYRNPKVWIDAIHPDDRQRVSDAFSQFRKTGKYSEEFRIVRPDGAIRWIWDRGVLIRNESGEVTRVAGIAEDITERKQTEDELKESEKRFRNLSEAAFEGIAFTEKGLLVDANEAFADILGYSLEELKGKQVVELVAPEHRELVIENIRSGYEGIYEHRGLHKDGSLLDLEIHGRSVTHQGRKMRLTAIRDITERKQAQEALFKEKKFTEDAINAQTDTFFLFDPGTGKAIRWNKAFTDISGYTDGEIARMPAPASYYSPEDVERAAASIQKVLKEGAGTIELELICKDGRKVPTEYRVSILNDDQGEPKYIISIGRDITERKMVEEKVRESEKNYRSLFEGGTDGIIIADMDTGQYIHVNPAVCQKLGYTEEEIKAVSQFKGIHPKEETERIQHLFYMQAKGEISIAEDIPFIKKDGTIRYFDVNSVHVEFSGVRRVVGLLRDITERKEAEEALQESEQRYRTIFDGSRDAIFITAEDAGFVEVNEAASVLTGYSPEELKEMSIPGLHEEEDTQAYKRFFHRIMAGEQITSEAKILRRDGTKVDTEFSNRRIMIGDVPYMHTAARDITERKRAEKEIQEYEKRLRSLASELSLAEERQRHQIATELHDNTSQELAFALTKLQNIRETASTDDPESLDDVCGMMGKVVENIRNMTFDICSPTLYKFGLEAAVSELLEDKLGERDEVSYSFSDDKKAKPLPQDIQVALFQSVRELVNNTIKHARAHNVAVDIQKCENTIRITVNDDGVGFKVEELESPERPRGGFGLFSIAERLKYIGGSFEFQSQPGRGSSFTLEAPLKTEANL